jgi:hypothetical protein
MRIVVASVAVTALFLGVSGVASAQHVRRRFDPDDLEFEPVRMVHADLGVGVVRGETAGRWLSPDFDIDVGLAPNVELGVDGAWAIEGTETRLFAFDHRAPDNLWLSSKVGLWDVHDETTKTGWAFGAQLGPRVAIAPGFHGAGFQALLLFGRSIRRLHLVLNVGGLLEPQREEQVRPSAVLTGLDVVLDLDDVGKWSLTADVSGVFFFSPDRNQLVSTAGVVCGVATWLDVGVMALAGFLGGGDQYGAIGTVSPKIAW